MDIAHALKLALTTGRVKVGLEESLTSAKAKEAKLLIVATTCPDATLLKEKKVGSVPIYHYEGTAADLGAACGKPFPISTLAVIDAGSSAILTVETSA
jgi:large subunit ribosomal protein L30e